jgi:GNAT superfamily N-acetyltransferase
MELRTAREDDLPALYAISLATGHAGGDASHLHRHGRLIGEIYSAPYAVLAPELAVVAEDADGVAGYVVGATDTAAWEARLERDWWPRLRTVYPDPGETPHPSWDADLRRSWMIHHPVRTPAELTGPHPAHLHMNLLPRIQGQGVGPRLLAAWFARAADQSASAVHIGVNRANVRGAAFWARQGFEDLPPLGGPFARTRWMGRRIR